MARARAAVAVVLLAAAAAARREGLPVSSVAMREWGDLHTPERSAVAALLRTGAGAPAAERPSPRAAGQHRPRRKVIRFLVNGSGAAQEWADLHTPERSAVNALLGTGARAPAPSRPRLPMLPTPRRGADAGAGAPAPARRAGLPKKRYPKRTASDPDVDFASGPQAEVASRLEEELVRLSLAGLRAFSKRYFPDRGRHTGPKEATARHVARELRYLMSPLVAAEMASMSGSDLIGAACQVFVTREPRLEVLAKLRRKSLQELEAAVVLAGAQPPPHPSRHRRHTLIQIILSRSPPSPLPESAVIKKLRQRSGLANMCPEQVRLELEKRAERERAITPDDVRESRLAMRSRLEQELRLVNITALRQRWMHILPDHPDHRGPARRSIRRLANIVSSLIPYKDAQTFISIPDGKAFVSAVFDSMRSRVQHNLPWTNDLFRLHGPNLKKIIEQLGIRIDAKLGSEKRRLVATILGAASFDHEVRRKLNAIFSQ